MRATFKKYTLQFKQAAGTSRGVYTTRDSWFIFLSDGTATGIGECAPLPGLSLESPKDMGIKLHQVCGQIGYFSSNPEELRAWPSIRFGLEMAMIDLKNGGKRELFPSDFTRGEQGIPINGLIWMGTPENMKKQIRTKLDSGFSCIKMKIGALDFETELQLLRELRKEHPAGELSLRVDANGAFAVKDAPEKLKRLSDLGIHSVEQPIEAGQWNEMAALCATSPIPIALDEELIGIADLTDMQKMLDLIRPAYLILKPSLHGGFAGCQKWIEEAAKRNTGWWVTSALESNVGLNAIAQWTFHLNAMNEQGLGTGQLFTNNFDSPLEISGEKLWYRPEKKWNIGSLTEDEPNDEFF